MPPGRSRTRPGRGSRGSAAARRSARPRRSSPRCRCRARTGGTFSSTPSPAARSRSSRFAATPPPIASRAPGSAFSARSTRRISASTIACLVGGGEVGRAARRLLLAQVAHRVQQRGLEPREREVEARDPLRRAGTRTPPDPPRAPAWTAPGRPDTPARAAARPCRTPRRRRRRASAPSTSYAPGSSTRASSVWPPDASRHRNGGSIGPAQVVRRHVALQVVDGRERQPPRRGERLRRSPRRSAARRPAPAPG